MRVAYRKREKQLPRNVFRFGRRDHGTYNRAVYHGARRGHCNNHRRQKQQRKQLRSGRIVLDRTDTRGYYTVHDGAGRLDVFHTLLHRRVGIERVRRHTAGDLPRSGYRARAHYRVFRDFAVDGVKTPARKNHTDNNRHNVHFCRACRVLDGGQGRVYADRLKARKNARRKPRRAHCVRAVLGYGGSARRACYPRA